MTMTTTVMMVTDDEEDEGDNKGVKEMTILSIFSGSGQRRGRGPSLVPVSIPDGKNTVLLLPEDSIAGCCHHPSAVDPVRP